METKIILPLSGLSHLDFVHDTVAFERHKITTLMGRSGVGKTSILHCLKRFLIAKHDHISLIQHQHNLLPWKNVSENITISNLLTNTKMDPVRLEYALRSVNLTDVSLFYPKQLSQGMMRRVAMARVLYEDAPYILMDEPFTNLDEATLFEIYEVFKNFLRNKTVVFTTHDKEEADLFSNILYHLHGQPIEITKVSL